MDVLLICVVYWLFVEVWFVFMRVFVEGGMSFDV